MTTLREVLAQRLPEDILEKALKNADNPDAEYTLDEWKRNEFYSTPLSGAFTWSNTPEGFEYWKEINLCYFPQ